MGQPIKSNEIIEQNALVDFIAKGEIALDIMQKMREEFKEVAKASKKVVSGGGALKKAKDIEKFREAIDKTNAAFRETQRLEKEEVKLQAKLDASYSKTATDVAKLKLEVNRRNKQLKEEAILSSKTTGNYEKASLTLRRLKRQYQNLAVAQGTNSKAARRARVEIIKQDKALKKIDAQVGNNFRNVGNYTGGIRKLAAAFGLTAGIAGFIRALGKAITTIVAFDKAQAELAGVLGTNKRGVKELTEDSRRLGSTTAKTASEVTALQIAYSRLGFSQAEILKLTKPSINGSIALNASLEDTANLTGAIVNSFDQFGATDAPEILDVMTLATQRSALNFEQLQSAIPNVAGAANAAGIPFNKLVALLGKLSDSGIDASKSSTALRNIFIESEAQGLSYEEILEKIQKSTGKLTTATDAFGKRASVSASILANNIGATADLEKELDNAGGTAERVANVQLDTLDGSIKLLSSAWEGFILSLESGDGFLGNFLRGAIGFATDFLNLLSGGRKEVSDLVVEQAKLNVEFNNGINSLKNSNIPLKARKQIIDDLNQNYSEYLPNLITEQTSLEDLEAIQAKFNEGARERLRLASRALVIQNTQEDQEERLKLIVAFQTDNYSKLGFTQRQLFSAMTDFQKGQILEELTKAYGDVDASLIDLIESTKTMAGETDNYSFLSSAFTANIKAETEAVRSNASAKRSAASAQKVLNETLNAIDQQKRKDEIEAEKKLTDELIADASRRALETGEAETEFIEEQIDKEFNLRKKRVEAQRKFLLSNDKLTAEQRILINLQFDEKIRNIQDDRDKRIISADEKVNVALENNAQKRSKKILDAAEKEAEDKKAQDEADKKAALKKKKEQEELIEGVKVLATETIAFLDRISDKQLAIIDKQATKQQKRIDNLQAKAVEGRLDLTDSVAEEEKRLEELEARRAKIEKQKQRRQAFITGLGILESKIKNNETGALSKTFSDLIKLSSFVTSLPTFFEGTENVSGTDASMKLNTPIDPFVVRVHPGERIMSASDNAKIGKMSNSELVEVASMYKTGFVDQPVYQQSGTDSMAIYRMTKAITEGNKKLLDKPTYLGGDFDDAREAWVLSIQKGATLEKRALKINRGY